jgi:hypothetical protein
MQGDGEFRLAGAGPKHAAAYDVESCRHGGAAPGTLDCGNANVSQRDLTEFYFPVWKQVAKANATSVMCSCKLHKPPVSLRTCGMFVALSEERARR